MLLKGPFTSDHESFNLTSGLARRYSMNAPHQIILFCIQEEKKLRKQEEQRKRKEEKRRAEEREADEKAQLIREILQLRIKALQI